MQSGGGNAGLGPRYEMPFLSRIAGWRRSCLWSLPGSFQRVSSAVADLLFPPSCLACDAELPPQPTLLCQDCRDGIRFSTDANCQRCAAPLAKLGSKTAACPYCRRRRYRFHSTVALGCYQGSLQQIILRMKHAMHEPLATAIGLLLGDRVRRQWDHRGLAGSAFDGVAPVPMHWWRRLRRGTPAAELLAESVARETGWRLVRDLIVCRRATRKQGTLSPADRFRNVADAFAVGSRYDVQGAKILLVDDVMTTGATLNAIARALRDRGASEVHVAVVARGTGN